MLKVIKNFFDDRPPEEWIRDFGNPVPQDNLNSIVMEITTEKKQREHSLNANDDLPWHHDNGYKSDVHPYVALYCEEAENAGAIQFCDMAKAYDEAPEWLRKQEECVNSVRQFFDQNENHPCKFKDKLEEKLYKRQRATHNLIQDGYFFFSEAYTETGKREDLMKHCFQEKFITTHEYKKGDLLIYDNIRLCHRRNGTVNGTKKLLRFALSDLRI